MPDCDSYFIQKSKEISQTIQMDKRCSDKLDSSVNLWCQEYNFSPVIENYILQNYKNIFYEKLMFPIIRHWEKEKPLPPLSVRFLSNKTEIKKVLEETIIRSSRMTTFLVFLGFTITAVCYLIYVLDQKENRTSVDDSSTRTLRTNLPKEQILVLVINVGKATVINNLRNKTTLESSDGEQLCDATELLWVGSQEEFNSIFQKCFISNNEFQVPEDQESEYDIYLVKIQLKQAEKGFLKDGNKIDRMDAFRNLANLAVARSFEVSPRLKVEAYQNTDVYCY